MPVVGRMAGGPKYRSVEWPKLLAAKDNPWGQGKHSKGKQKPKRRKKR